MYVFTIPAAKWDERNPSKADLRLLINKHQSHAGRLINLAHYYNGEQKILADTDRQNRLVCNHAKDITDTASSYFLGNPISYDCDDSDNLPVLLDALRYAGADEADGDNSQDLSVYGMAYEYIYASQNEPTLKIKSLEPEHCFVVYDDTIEQNELFGVYYYVRKDDTNHERIHYMATILTKNYKWELDILDDENYQALFEAPTPHYLGEVPLIEYKNNKLGIGDFEPQIPLIDAYNALMSDRVTDKEQFIDAILVLYGTLLADGEYDEDGNLVSNDEARKALAQKKILELPDSAKAEYLTRTFDENGIEILKRALEQDIHKFSHIPCLSDESFGGNVSGVAMEFKLLGLENITKIKTRYYKIGLRKRLRIFCNYLSKTKAVTLDPALIKATFSRALPKNLLEISQYALNLKGIVSRQTLLAQIPFVEDPEKEVAIVDAENEQAIRLQQEIFMERSQENTTPEEEEDREAYDGERKEDKFEKRANSKKQDKRVESNG